MFDIIKFIKKSKLEDIKNSLVENMKEYKYCDKLIGSGSFGDVIEHKIGSHIKVLISKNKKIKINVVVKHQKDNQTGLIFELYNKMLYIFGETILFDIIILSYMKELYNKKKSVHLQLMLGYGYCNNEDIFVILERNGLKKNVEKQMDEKIFYKNKYISKIITLGDLIRYICIFHDKNTMKIKLPNDIECDVIGLIDYITISIIHTYKLLYENNIYVRDLYLENIFIHWINKRSYFNDINLKDIKNIYYKNKDNIIKIETFGLIIKIGDVGHFYIKPRKDIILYSNTINFNNIDLINSYFIDGFEFIYYIFDMKYNLPHNIFKKLVINEIMELYPYNNFSPFSLLKTDILSYEQILDKFEKYEINNQSSLLDKSKSLKYFIF